MHAIPKLQGITHFYIGTPVILSPSEVIFRPGEGPVELLCVRNTTAGSTLWRVNGSSAISPYDIGRVFPGHGADGVNLVINDPSNNTEYICVSVVDNMNDIDSEPVYLYVAGMLYHYSKVMNIFAHKANYCR